MLRAAMITIGKLGFLAAACAMTAAFSCAAADTDAQPAARWESAVTRNLEVEDAESISPSPAITPHADELRLESVQVVEAHRIPCVSVGGEPCRSEPHSLSLQSQRAR